MASHDDDDVAPSKQQREQEERKVPCRVSDNDECMCCKKPIDASREAFIRFPTCAHRVHVVCEFSERPSVYGEMLRRQQDQSVSTLNANSFAVMNTISCTKCTGGETTTTTTTKKPATELDAMLTEVRKQALVGISDAFNEALAERENQIVDLRTFVNTQLAKEKPKLAHVRSLFDVNEQEALTMRSSSPEEMASRLAAHEIRLDQLLALGLNISQIYAQFGVRSFPELMELGFSCDRHLRNDLCLFGDVVSLYGVDWQQLHSEAGLTARTLTRIKFDGADLARAGLTVPKLFDELKCTRSLFIEIVRHSYEIGIPLDLNTLRALGLTKKYVQQVIPHGSMEICANQLGWMPAKVRLLFGRETVNDKSDPTGERILNDLAGIPPPPPLSSEREEEPMNTPLAVNNNNKTTTRRTPLPMDYPDRNGYHRRRHYNNRQRDTYYDDDSDDDGSGDGNRSRVPYLHHFPRSDDGDRQRRGRGVQPSDNDDDGWMTHFDNNNTRSLATTRSSPVWRAQMTTRSPRYPCVFANTATITAEQRRRRQQTTESPSPRDLIE